MESPFAPSAAPPAFSPPVSPGTPLPQRPLSAMVRPAPRSNSRLSNNNRSGGGSRASDEDGRTSVKVAVRIRPPLRPTDPGFDLIPQRFQRSMAQATSNTSLTIDAPQGRKLFVFDRVFGPEIDQEGIFDYVGDCVGAFIQGYNVSLLAYGQSGAGKSYTMGTSGPLEQDDLEMMGVIPRAATALFEKLDAPANSPKANRSSMSHLRTPARYSTQSVPQREKTWSLKATYVEIYNEQLRDLLLPDTVPVHERGAVTIREDVKGNILLTGLRQVEINSVEELMNALNLGSTLRQTDATAINARSSRSHAVFSLNLVQRNKKAISSAEKRFSAPVEAMPGTEPWVTTDSKLHFVDLAGSERLKNTGAQGERAKEGISINAGLAALGKVISQLSSRQPGSHVSYRDSRLTRLLQDSLGGNAITYMIACVTPAEFHLSETLNTVQYAQRARAIQSKPRIQQVEEGDKQAIIDRLKAEVAFLRDQIRSAERGGAADRRVLAAGERSERQSEREAELQNQLLDFQENYTNLSQRHTKLIAEMAKARDNENAQNQQQLEESLGDSATARLNRSNSFAQAVEQVVLEYEKTIQSLEQSLSNTRTTLANTETSLLEKETKCAYVETISGQLQARLQKLMDREASTETYLHELEAKLDGHTSGEEKNAAILVELRKEIARVRESEATAEEYISTLEERLAEADQDAELMQREIDRLEQVIERQRSLGKLDSLLYELDHIQQDAKDAEPEAEVTNGASSHRYGSGSRSRSISSHSRSQSHVSRHSQREDAIPEAEEDGLEENAANGNQSAFEEATDVDGAPKPPKAPSFAAPHHETADYPTSPAQSKFVADKLETVSQELVDLQMEHEATVTDFELLQAKYEEALKAIAELQDAIDESRHPQRPRDSIVSLASEQTRPSSYFSDARSSMAKDGRHFSTPQSLSTELTSALGSPIVADNSDAETLVQRALEDSSESTTPAGDQSQTNARLAVELGRLKALASEKETAERELATKYAQLEEEHSKTLDIVEELRTEMAKAQAGSGLTGSSSPLIRRKSSQNVMMVDRAHRSFATLRNIATENFEEQPDVMQNFTVNLEAAMHELHARSERIQRLEADVTSAKKEMETKMTIISGLTRERSSLKSSPMDISVISTLRDQLEKNEKERKEMQDAHSAREVELQSQLDALRSEMDASKTTKDSTSTDHESRATELQEELSQWEEKHRRALESMQATEQEMNKTIEGLEAQLAAVQSSDPSKDGEAKQAEAKRQNMVAFLQNEIDEYKAIINSNATKVAELEQGHAATKALLEEASKSRELATDEIETHKSLVAKLEQQLAEYEEAIKSHQEELKAMQARQAEELEAAKAASKQENDEVVQRLLSEHSENLKILEGELTEACEELMKVATQVAFALGLDVSVEAITDRINDLIADSKSLAREQHKSAELERTTAELSGINDTIMRELEAVKSTLADLLLTPGEPLRSPHPSVHDQLSAIRTRMGELESKNKKNSRLVEELEDQLQTNFDQAQIASNRVSTMQTEQQVRIDEANAARVRVQSELDTIKEEYAALQAKLEGATDVQRSNSLNSNLRKSSSVASLPSPPPAIPLPPLPGTTSSSPPPGVPATPTQGRPPSKDLAMSQIQQDQEARIRTIEKHLSAEKQLTATLEEALTDLEEQSKKVKADCDGWRRRCTELESEMRELREKPPQDNRWSLHAVEEERRKRRDAELANQRLEERMNAISKKNKKKGSLNCF